MATRGDPFTRLREALHGNEFALGISFLELLSHRRVAPAPRTRLIFWVPANLLKLVERARRSEADRQFLLQVMRSFVSPRAVDDRASRSRITQNHVGILIENLSALARRSQVRPIGEVDPALERLLEQTFPRSMFAIRLSPEQNFVARYVGAVLRWSKKTGKAVLEGGERALDQIGSTIASLRIPERTTRFLEEKERLATELLAEFGISKNTKKIIAITTATAGAFLAPTAPLAAVAGVTGLLIAYTDP